MPNLFARLRPICRCLAVVLPFLLGALPAAAQTKLSIGFIPVLGSAQLFVIEGEGWAKQENIQLTVIRFDSGPAMIQALAANQLDLYLGGVGPIMVARGQGIPAKVLASAAIEELAVLARGPLADAVAKHPGDLPAAIADFTKSQGRKPKFATQPPGSVPDTVMRYWLDAVSKVSFDAVEILGIGIDATQQAFLSGAVDAACVREPTLTLIQDRNKAAKLIAVGADMFPKQPGGVLAGLTNLSPEKKAAIDRLVKLHVRATEMLIKEPKRAAPHVLKVLGGGIVPLDVIERALVSPISKFVADPAVIVESTGKMQDYQIKLGVLKQAVPLDELFDPEPYKRAIQ